MLVIDSSKVTQLMIKRCMTIRSLARAANLHELTVAKIQRQNSSATTRTLGLLAKALNVNGEDLILKEEIYD